MLILHRQQATVHDLSGTFAGLMDLYEQNYIGLRRLIPTLPEAATPLVSRVPGNLDLHLQVVERFRYTTDLRLTYLFERQGGLRAEPDLAIRIYHDARQSEVLSAHLRHWPEFEAEHFPSLLARWRVNRFLYKWLSYSLHQGHRFEPAGATCRHLSAGRKLSP